MRLFEPPFIFILLIVVVLLFGAPKLPGMARSLGQSMRIFKSEVKQMKDDDPRAAQQPPVQQSPVQQAGQQQAAPQPYADPQYSAQAEPGYRPAPPAAPAPVPPATATPTHDARESAPAAPASDVTGRPGDQHGPATGTGGSGAL